MHPAAKDKIGGTPSIRIVFDVFKCSGQPFDDVLPDSDIYDLWECLDGDVKNIQNLGIEQVLNPASSELTDFKGCVVFKIKGVCLRIAFLLKNPILLTSLSLKPEFDVNKVGAKGQKTEVYRIRLPDFDEIAYELGQEVTVTIQNTLFTVTVEEMIAWIKPFGEITKEPRY